MVLNSVAELGLYGTVPIAYFNCCKHVFLCNCSFPGRKLVDQEQRNKTKNARSTGCGGDDDAVPDEPYIGGVNLRLFTGGAPIRDKPSSLVVPDSDLDPAPDCDLSSVKDATKK